MKYLLIIVSLIILSSCASEEDTLWIEFLAKEGSHEFIVNNNKAHRKRLDDKLNVNSIEFVAGFHKSCMYDYTLLGTDAGDINKLFGITVNGSDPLKGSLMFGWNYLGGDYINVTAFYNRSDHTHMYENVKFVSKTHEILHDFMYHFEITSYDSIRWFINHEEIMVIPKEEIGEVNNLQFYTRPWFGGQSEAPNDMKIYVHLPY